MLRNLKILDETEVVDNITLKQKNEFLLLLFIIHL